MYVINLILFPFPTETCVDITSNSSMIMNAIACLMKRSASVHGNSVVATAAAVANEKENRVLGR
jgi:hypothetical protein